MGFSYEWNSENGNVKIEGFNNQEDIQANVDVFGLVRALKDFKKTPTSDLCDDEWEQMNLLEEYIELI